MRPAEPADARRARGHRRVAKDEPRAKARSRADWKRSSGFFSRQCGTMRSSARRDVLRRRRELRRLLLQDRGHRLDRGVAPERPPAGEHLVEHGAEREDVRAVVDGLPAHLLRRHVPDRPQHACPARSRRDAVGARRRRGSGRPGRCFARPKSRILTRPSREEEVLRLEVAVDDPLVVRGREPAGDLRARISTALRGGSGAVCEPLRAASRPRAAP